MQTSTNLGRERATRRRFLQVAAGIGVASVVGVDPTRGEQAIEIEDWHDLDAIRENLDDDYVLKNDLDESTPGYDEHVGGPEDGWVPIGGWPYDDPAASFTGTFDGNDHEISGLYSRGVATGLFEVVHGGTVTSVTVSEVDLTVGDRGGALVAHNAGTVTDSCASGIIFGEGVGGLVGWNDGGDVRESSASVEITRETGTARNAGGLVGRNDGGTVADSSASGDLTNVWESGGLVGWNTDGEIVRSSASGDLTDATESGGLVGINESGEVRESQASGTVTGGRRLGGLVAINDEGEIRTSSATGTVTGPFVAGGLVGSNRGGAIVASSASGDVIGAGEAAIDVIYEKSLIGGLVGHNSGEVRESWTTGTATGAVKIGGLAGRNRGEIVASSAVGGVTALSDAGGLVGTNDGGTVTDTWASVDITVSSDEPSRRVRRYYEQSTLGGLVGTNDDGTVTDSWASSSLPDAGRVGGIVGHNEGGEVRTTYWDGLASDQVDGIGEDDGEVTGLTELSTEEMSGASARDTMSALDFEDSWTVQTAPDGYPALQWQPTVDTDEWQATMPDTDAADESSLGFGIASALTGLGATAYLLQRRYTRRDTR